ncbi:hypothetical protein BJ508DRAFT_365953 [Ascobolus immersus RN42]|uniref:Uncharacterized protein n=1 Tax=Ascobolus immersus RN42 TaxID=1160509 RepID=A0A3N4HSB8_ASCIM|nr:hypothetical protein BJ508DRAFT_365953 [Ascobolus immersus RN42]
MTPKPALVRSAPDPTTTKREMANPEPDSNLGKSLPYCPISPIPEPTSPTERRFSLYDAIEDKWSTKPLYEITRRLHDIDSHLSSLAMAAPDFPTYERAESSRKGRMLEEYALEGVKMALIHELLDEAGIQKLVLEGRTAWGEGLGKRIEKDQLVANALALLFLRKEGDACATYYRRERSGAATIIIAKTETDPEAVKHAARLTDLLKTKKPEPSLEFNTEALKVIIPYCYPTILARFTRLMTDPDIPMYAFLEMLFDQSSEDTVKFRDEVLSSTLQFHRNSGWDFHKDLTLKKDPIFWLWKSESKMPDGQEEEDDDGNRHTRKEDTTLLLNLLQEAFSPLNSLTFRQGKNDKNSPRPPSEWFPFTTASHYSRTYPNDPISTHALITHIPHFLILLNTCYLLGKSRFFTAILDSFYILSPVREKKPVIGHWTEAFQAAASELGNYMAAIYRLHSIFVRPGKAREVNIEVLFATPVPIFADRAGWYGGLLDAYEERWGLEFGMHQAEFEGKVKDGALGRFKERLKGQKRWVRCDVLLRYYLNEMGKLEGAIGEDGEGCGCCDVVFKGKTAGKKRRCMCILLSGERGKEALDWAVCEAMDGVKADKTARGKCWSWDDSPEFLSWQKKRIEEASNRVVWPDGCR